MTDVKNHVYCGDALSTLRKLDAESVDCIVTSPPYFGQRDYGHPGQIGMESMSGPVGIVDVVQDTYNQCKSGGAALVFLNMLNLMILLSANLGVMNLLPIPALDGGRLVFLVIEVIRGKRVPPEKEGYVHMIGMVCLLLLMVFVMYHDIQRVFF